MRRYSRQDRMLVAVDCIVFGFDGKELKLLLVQRSMEPQKGKWSLMGGFAQEEESLENAAIRILKKLTGLDGPYMEQLHTFSEPGRDPVERTVSVAYFTLIDTHQYEKQLSHEYHAEWFPVNEIPELIFDHRQMIEMGRGKLRYKAAFHPILFELLPSKFTLPQLQSLYEGVYDTSLDKRNFSRKILSTRLLVKLKGKNKQGSRKGAFYYRLDKKRYETKFNAFLNFIPNPGKL